MKRKRFAIANSKNNSELAKKLYSDDMSDSLNKIGRIVFQYLRLMKTECGRVGMSFDVSAMDKYVAEIQGKILGLKPPGQRCPRQIAIEGVIDERIRFFMRKAKQNPHVLDEPRKGKCLGKDIAGTSANAEKCIVEAAKAAAKYMSIAAKSKEKRKDEEAANNEGQTKTVTRKGQITVTHIQENGIDSISKVIIYNKHNPKIIDLLINVRRQKDDNVVEACDRFLKLFKSDEEKKLLKASAIKRRQSSLKTSKWFHCRQTDKPVVANTTKVTQFKLL